MDAYDVVVVGSGAGGGTLVHRLAAKGLSVCLLERGEDLPPPTTPDEQSGARYFAAPESRSNLLLDEQEAPQGPFLAEGSTVGGTTTLFSGNALRFHPDDFRRRAVLGDVPGADVADWPFDYDEIEPYYAAAEEMIGVAGDAAPNPFEPRRSTGYFASPLALDEAGARFTRAARQLGWHPYPIPSVISAANGRSACTNCGFCSGYLCTFHARWSSREPIAEAVATGRATLRAGCRALRVLTTPAGDRATAVEYVDRTGARHTVEGRAIVLAANAIQTARLLLASATAQHPHGLANGSGLVGRNLMTHAHDLLLIAGHLGEGVETHHSSGCRIAIQDFYDARAAGSPLGATLEPRAIGSRTLWRRVEPVAGAVDEATRDVRFRSNLTVLSIVEDLPQPQNCVTLSSSLRDPLGESVPVIRYRPHALDLETSRYAAARATELLDAAGAREVFQGPWLGPRFHIFGTCRMGHDPARSVVDAHGGSHEVPNLFVADASLFVSSAGVNPALTIAALALRVADRIATRFARRELS